MPAIVTPGGGCTRRHDVAAWSRWRARARPRLHRRLRRARSRCPDERATSAPLRSRAQRRDVFWLVLKDGAVLCATGIVVGMIGAAIGTRWLASELHGVGPMDPLTYAAVALLMLTVTLLACYVPTRRATRVDPLIVLRDY